MRVVSFIDSIDQEGVCCLSRGFVVPALNSFTKSIKKDSENASEAYVARAKW